MNNTHATRLATRLAFFLAGFQMASWAPLVPFAKANTGANEGLLGLLLLCVGIGSLIAMPITGWISAQRGARSMIILGGAGLILILPALAVASNPVVLGLALLIFGASLGTIDVAMNVHAVDVERDSTKPLMSGFHAMFSVGGFCAAGGMTLLLSWGLAPVHAAFIASLAALIALIIAAPRLLRANKGEPPRFALPRGLVLLLAVLAAITFLVEGAILDWGALLVLERGLVGQEQGGMAYMLFAAAMTVGRLTGDRVTAALGRLRVLVFGGALAIAGLALTLLVGWPPLAMAGFVLIGLGAANIVPVLFSAAGAQKVMPAGLAVASVTTVGYFGILAGPAAVGFVADHSDLTTSFWVLAALMALIPLSARAATR